MWINQLSLWRVASETPDLRLPSQPQGITDHDQATEGRKLKQNQLIHVYVKNDHYNGRLTDRLPLLLHYIRLTASFQDNLGKLAPER